MKALVLKSFKYGADGRNAVLLTAGEEAEINDELIAGLKKEGFITTDEPKKAVEAKTPAKAVKSAVTDED